MLEGLPFKKSHKTSSTQSKSNEYTIFKTKKDKLNFCRTSKCFSTFNNKDQSKHKLVEKQTSHVEFSQNM